MPADDFKAYRDYMAMLNWSPSLQQRMKHDLSTKPLPSDVLPSTPAFDAYEALRTVQSAWQRYPLNNDAAIKEHWNCFLPQRLGDLPAPLAVDMHFYRFIAALFDDNLIYWPQKPETLDRELLRRYAIRLQPEFLTAAEAAIEELVKEIIDHLPDAAFKEPGPSAITIPLYDISRNAVLIPTLVFVRSGKYEFRGEPILHQTNYDLLTCMLGAHGLTRDTWKPEKHEIIACCNADGRPAAVLNKYLSPDSHLQKLLTAQVPFDIPTQRFGAHGIIIAPPEYGKTQLLSTFIARFLKEDVGMVVLDPHGDLFTSLKDKVPPERLVVLDPTTDPPPLNVFDFGASDEEHALEAFTYLMSSITGGLSDKQAGILPYLLRLIRVIPDATIETLSDLVTEVVPKGSTSKFLKYVNKLDDLDRKFFIDQFLGDGKMKETKQAIAWKLGACLGKPAFKAMFTATRNSFNLYQAMEERKIVLVRAIRRTLGQDGMTVFLQFIVSQYLLAAFQREAIPEKDRKLCILIADEAKHVFNDQTEVILTECRKYGYGFLAATQLIQQIPQNVKAAIYGATAIKIAGPIAATDAMLMAREMHTDAEDIRSCKSYERSCAEWMVYTSKVTDRAVKISVPFGALDNLDEPSSEEASEPDVIITPPLPKDCPFKERDIIQVTTGGYDRYPEGVRVRKIYPEDRFLFIDGSESGIPFSDCHHFKPKDDPPKNQPPKPQSPPETTLDFQEPE